MTPACDFAYHPSPRATLLDCIGTHTALSFLPNARTDLRGRSPCAERVGCGRVRPARCVWQWNPQRPNFRRVSS